MAIPKLIRIHPRPSEIYASRNFTVLITDLDGIIRGRADTGLYVHETRMLSRLEYQIDGRAPECVASSNIEQHSWMGYYIATPPGYHQSERDRGSGHMSPVSEQSLELRVSRRVEDGIHEELTLTNYSDLRTSFRFGLRAEGDFTAYGAADSGPPGGGKATTEWDGTTLRISYRAHRTYKQQDNEGSASIARSLELRVSSPGAPAWEGGELIFDVTLFPHERWHACVDFLPTIEGRRYELSGRCGSGADDSSALETATSRFLSAATTFVAPHHNNLAHHVCATLDQGKADLAALRLNYDDNREKGWTVAAGLPLYLALFGRDTLTAAWQAAMVSPDLMLGTLERLAALQGKEHNDWRDEAPGRMLHEAHTGPLEILQFNPRQRYYGSVTTSAFYPVVVAELWHWTGDKALVAPYIEPAVRALEWLDRESDIDGDGFYEYLTRSRNGVKHQAWKDSENAMVAEDGSAVEPPIATCEEQGFVYAAKQLFAEVLWWFDRKDEAKRLYREASALKERFNETFWLEDQSFIAMGVGPDKRPIRSRGSNPGHCMATGIVDRSLVQTVADGLLEEDLFSGWGVRTLSSRHPAYNPYSYHRGSVWPVEQGSFALGFNRYGLHEHLHTLAKAQFEAAMIFDFYRLPEVFSGHPRDADHPFPAFYPKSNSPQAWSASSVFLHLQSMLGLYPYAPLNLLIVDPHLPDWLPEIVLRSLRVGDATVDLHFYRGADGRSSYTVLDHQGPLHIIRQPSPWSLTAGPLERTIDLLQSLLPGR